MKFKNGAPLFIFLFVSIAMITCSVTWSGCANIVPPSGGPRDTLPPRLVSVTPADSNLNFIQFKAGKPTKLVFTFDEYIDVKEVQANVIVNPVPKVDPIVESKLRVMTVRIKDTVQPNTTYVLNFGRAIRDVNEGNVLKNFTYVFSTGKYIDSTQFSGRVIVASTGLADSSLVVILHRKLNDSAVVNDRPRYLTRVDTTGHFHFNYLEPGTYALYAMKDEGGTHRYLSKAQLFAFADSPVVIKKNSPPVTLYAYAEKADAKSSKSSGGSSGSGGVKQVATKPSSKEKEKDKRLQFSTNITNGVFDVLDTLYLKFNSGIKVFDSTKMRFTDENYVDINPAEYQFQRDSTNKKFWLFYNWPLETKFHLILFKDFAQDSAGRKLLKIDTIPFHTKSDIEYGEVRIRIRNLDLSRNPVLEFIAADAVKFAFPFVNTREFKVTLFPPGDYELRILYDDNKNGVWDPGQFFGGHRQPEKVFPLRKKFTVKANWDNDVDFTL
jgi:Big-like domain-containing protein